LNRLSADVLVIGRGLAGGVAALRAADSGRDVIVMYSGQTATSWAQGGIVYKGDSDPTSLVEDIWNSGCRMGNREAIDIVANEGPVAVEEWLLKRLKVPFDGDLALEAAHASPRILHAKDSSGAAIAKALDLALQSHPRIRLFEGHLVNLLVTDRHDARPARQYAPSRVVGAYAFVPSRGDVVPVVARAVVLATGGFSRLYLHATGPSSSVGEGIAAAHGAGARTHHLEFVQFHPTALFTKDGPRRLLTEALRGAGARLLDGEGREFVDPLAARDVVARAIHGEMLRSGAAHVWLDLRGVDALCSRFPWACSKLREHGFDPEKDLIPVVPAAHYTLGGVWTGMNAATSLEGLFAAGEVACTGLHGANRLASTSLLEALVFGDRAGRSAATAAKDEIDFEPRPWRSEKGDSDPALLQQDWQVLRQTLWNYVGLVRSGRRLRRAERLLVELRTEVESFYKSTALSPELIALRHGVLVATLVLYAALRNTESVGVHYVLPDEGA
jgi:L-aspartate oxidase